MSLPKQDSKLYMPDEYRYAALQVAVNKYGKSLTQLDQDSRREAEAIALRQYEIQSRVLSSPDAGSVVISGERLDRSVSEIIARYASPEEFYRELEDNGLDIEQFHSALDRELRVEAVMDKISASAEPCSDTDARLYYYLHPSKFQQPETREASHILITVNPDFPENCQDEAYSRLARIADRVHKKPHRFAEQAQKHSECPTAMNGGRLGRLPCNTLFPSLDKELFAMKEGSISDIIESPIGYHLLFCEKIHPAGLVPVSQALPAIIEKLTERNRKNRQREWLKQLLED